jgi:tetratricopeptide (TPR) repeat protein
VSDSPRIDDLRRRVERDPTSIAFAQLAEELRRAGQMQEAVETCRTGLSTHPGYVSARVTLARALAALDRLDEAQAELERVLRSAPENLTAVRGLADISRLGARPLLLGRAPRLSGDVSGQRPEPVRSSPLAPQSSPPLRVDAERAGKTIAALEDFVRAIRATSSTLSDRHHP